PFAYSATSGTFWQAPTGELAGVGNITTETGDGPAVVGDFWAGAAAFSTSTQAFVNSVTPAATGYTTDPGGDKPGYKKTTTTYAQTINDVVGRTTTTAKNSSADPSTGSDSADANWEASGFDYAGYKPSNPNNTSGHFNGYTFG